MSVKMPRGFAPTPVGGSQAVGATEKAGARRVGFGDAMRVKSAERPASTDPVRAAVASVAQEVAAGRIDRGEPAISAVIQRIVAASAGPSETPAQLRAKVSEIQATLGTDPNFTTRVNRRLEHAIAELAQA